MKLIQIAVSIFLLMDAIGNVPIFLSILKHIDPQRQRKIIIRELLLALGIIFAFYFVGDAILTFLGISECAVAISGGVILFIIGVKLVFPKESEKIESSKDQEPFLVPLAVPLVAGPAVLAGVMIISRQEHAHLFSLTAIFLAWVASTLILILAPQLQKLLKTRGLVACERFTGLILIMLAIQMLLNGITPVLKNCLTPVS